MTSDIRARLGGLFFLVLGGVLSKLTLFDVLTASANGTSSVSTSVKGVMIAPFCFFMGLLMLVGGHQGLSWVQSQQPSHNGGKWTKGGVAMMVALIAPGLALYFWLKHTLDLRGYH
jgi:hypothetical protein